MLHSNHSMSCINGTNGSDLAELTLAEELKPDVMGLVLMSAIMGCTIVGNSSVCWIIHKNSSLQTVPNRLVLNLAWCDLLTAVINGPFTLLVLAHNEWWMGHVLCQLNGFLTTFFGIASVLTLSIISLNRCFLIVYSSHNFKLFTEKNTSLMIAGVWLFSAACSFPPVVGWSSYSFIHGKAICTLIWSTDVSYTLVVLIFGVGVPFTIMIVSYYKIFAKVRESNRKIGLQRAKGKFSASTIKSIGKKPLEIPDIVSQATLAPCTVLDITHSSGLQSSSVPSKGSRNSKASTENTTLDRCQTSSGSSFGVGMLRNKIPQGIFRRESYASVDSRKTLRFLGDKHGRLHTADPFSEGKPPKSPLIRSGRRFSLDGPLHEVEPTCVTPVRKLSLDSAQSANGGSKNVNTRPVDGSRCSTRTHSGPGSYSSLDTVAMGHTNSWRSLSHENPTAVTQGNRTASLSYKISVDRPIGDLATAKSTSDIFAKKSAWNDDVKVTFTLFIVILVFVLSWAPISIVNCLETFLSYQIPGFLDRLTVYMVFLQSAVNPIIYGLMNRNFREGFRGIFCCMLPSDSPVREATLC